MRNQSGNRKKTVRTQRRRLGFNPPSHVVSLFDRRRLVLGLSRVDYFCALVGQGATGVSRAEWRRVAIRVEKLNQQYHYLQDWVNDHEDDGEFAALIRSTAGVIADLEDFVDTILVRLKKADVLESQKQAATSEVVSDGEGI